jgi:hypothetical protein
VEVILRLLNEVLQHGQNSGWGVARLYLGGKWVGEKLVIRYFLISFQRSFKNRPEVERRGSYGEDRLQ